jgi:hypothetical protein
VYKALAYVDTFVRLPSRKIAMVTKQTTGNFVLCEYVDGSGEVEIDAKFLKAADDPLKSLGAA